MRIPGRPGEVLGRKPWDEDYPHKELTEKIIGCAIRVHQVLGPGFLEAIYENALCQELLKQGIRYDRQRPVKILYNGVEVGEHRADIVVDDKVLVELKSVDILTPKHVAQVISTLKAFRMQIGLLLNFDEARLTEGLRRVVLTPDKLPSRQEGHLPHGNRNMP